MVGARPQSWPGGQGGGLGLGSKEWQGVPDAPRPKKEKSRFLKDSLWGGGGYQGARRGVQGLWFRGGGW